MENHQLSCYDTRLITSNGAWVEKGFIEVIHFYAYPLLIVQLCIVLVFTRVLAVAFRPLRQPRVVAEMLGGILIGPSLLGRVDIKGLNIGDLIFPPFSFVTLETLARLGLLYYLFTVGVGIDLEAIKRTGRKALAIAAATTALPFALSLLAASLVLRHNHSAPLEEVTTDHLSTNSTLLSVRVASGPPLTTSSSSNIFLAISLSITSVPILCRILTEVRLLNTDIGRLALSSAIINNTLCWLVLGLTMAFTETEASMFSFATVGAAASWVALVFCAVNVVRPALEWVARRTDAARPADPHHMGLILIGVAASACVSEAVGLHPFFGAFLFGLMLPGGPLAVKVLEMTEESALSYLMSLFFASSGFKIDAFDVKDVLLARGVAAIFVAAGCTVVAGTVLVARFHNMPLHQAVALGFLMNTKGIVQVLVLSMGIDRKVVEVEALPMIILLSALTTALVPPVVLAVEKPSKRHLARHKRRNIQLVKPGSELRVLACLHTVKNVSSLIGLLDASNPSKRSPIFLHALHLIRLVGRATAMLIVHQSGGQRRHRANGGIHADSEHIILTLEQYEQQTSGIAIQMLTAVAPYSAMHEDVCTLAEEKRVNVIILPFHKHPTGDDKKESIGSVNKNVLLSASCSVAILVDRGFGARKRATVREVALLFFGGPDDREALAFASRMADDPNICLTVLRFLPGDKTMSQSRAIKDDERVLDEHSVNEFRTRHGKNESVVYWEKVVDNCEEAVAVVRSIGGALDLYVVGRGSKAPSPLTAALEEWSECPELGPIGDLLASSDFGALVSVLVFQQYVVELPEGRMSPVRPYGDNIKVWNNLV